MTTKQLEAAQQPIDLEQLTHDIHRQVYQIEEQTVLGKDTTSDQEYVHSLISQYSDAARLSETERREQISFFDERMQKPSVDVYHYWIKQYAATANTASQTGNDNDTKFNTARANQVLARLAAADGWSRQVYESEQDKLNELIEKGYVEQQKSKRFAKLAAAVGGVSLMAIHSKFTANRYVKQQAAANQATQPSNKEKRSKKGLFIAVGAIAVGAAAIYYGYDMATHGHNATDAVGNLPHPPKGPLGTDLHNHIPQHGGNGGGNGIPNHHTGGGANHIPTNHNHHPAIERHAETLNHRGDTLWDHAKNLLNKKSGKKASNSEINNYTHRILKVNKLSEYKARRLPIGFRFIIPSHK